MFCARDDCLGLLTHDTWVSTARSSLGWDDTRGRSRVAWAIARATQALAREAENQISPGQRRYPMFKLGKSLLVLVLAALAVFAQTVKERPYFHPSGLPGMISDVAVQAAADGKPLPKDFVSPDADLKMMAAWALRHLIHNPRPELNYEPVF